MRTISPARVALTHALLIVACGLVLYPVLWVIKMALSPSQSFAMSPSVIPTELTLSNFVHIFTMNDGRSVTAA